MKKSKKERRPPGLVLKMLDMSVRSGDIAPVSDDAVEMYEYIYETRGPGGARRWIWWQLIRSVPRFIFNSILWRFMMFKNYLKIALRNIKKFKAYTLINILGLAIGMSCCILILLFVQDELSFDRNHDRADRIFRLVNRLEVAGGKSFDLALTSAPFAPGLKADFTEVEEAARIYKRRTLVAFGKHQFYENDLFYADPSLFRIFSFPLSAGSAIDPLVQPGSMVISEAVARKYFGEESALNQTLQVDGKDYRVSGIMEEMPKNSHLFADIFVSMKTLEQNPAYNKLYFQNWVRHEFYTYLLLREGFPGNVFQQKLAGFIEKYAHEPIKAVLGGNVSSQLQAVTDIHLFSHLQAEITPNSDSRYIYIFSIIAFFILLIACINFTNLATARTSTRSREVSIRKVVGARQTQVAGQFLSESLLFATMALLLTQVMVALAIPILNSLTGKALSLNYFSNIPLMAGIISILIFVVIASGVYPAIYISRLNPAVVLKSGPGNGPGKSLLRRGLVIMQFSISIFLIIATLVVMGQVDYLKNQKLGFDKQHVLVVPITSGSFRTDHEAIKADLMQHPDITGATLTSGVPGGTVAGDVVNLVSDTGNQPFTVRMLYTDYDFLETMGMEILQGRNFSKLRGRDAQEAFIINEAALRELNLASPLKAQFRWGDKKGAVIGVVRDFQFQSLRAEIDPLVIHIYPRSAHVFAIRIRPNRITETINFIKGKWHERDPAHPFEYHFMDETFDELYRREDKVSQLFTIFSLLAIFIASLGLLGLALFMVERRTKEIGVRKVLGASNGNVFTLIAREFVSLVLLANLIAWPTAYLIMSRWLQNFAYRIPLRSGIFILSAALALLIALVTISYQAIRAARSNPLDSLKYE